MGATPGLHGRGWGSLGWARSLVRETTAPGGQQPNEITVPQAFVDNPLALVSRLTSDNSFFGHTTFSAHRPVGAPLFFWRQAEGRGEPLPPH